MEETRVKYSTIFQSTDVNRSDIGCITGKRYKAPVESYDQRGTQATPDVQRSF